MKHNPYSHSKIEKYKKCPLSFKYSYLCEKEEKPQAAELQIGSGLHKFLDDYSKHLLSFRQESDMDKGIEILKKVASRYVKPEVRTEIMEEGEKVLEWFSIPVSNIDTFLSEERIGITKHFELTDYDNSDCYYRGIIDRTEVSVEVSSSDTGELGNSLTVIDYKFWQMPDVKPDIQTYLYSYVIYKYMKSFGYDRLFDSILIEIWNMRYRKTCPVRMDIGEIEKIVKEYLGSNIPIIEADEKFDPIVGDHCTTCEHRYYCESMLSNDNDIEQKISEYLQKKHEASSREKYLKDYIKKNGNIMVGGKMFGNFKKDRFSYPGGSVYDWLATNVGDDMAKSYFKLNNTEMTRICKKIVIIEPKELAENKPVNSFGFEK